MLIALTIRRGLPLLRWTFLLVQRRLNRLEELMASGRLQSSENHPGRHTQELWLALRSVPCTKQVALPTGLK